MNLELGWRLVQWEVRHAVRGATFWVMVGLVALAPWVGAFLYPNDLLSGMGGAQVLALSWVVSLWTVFSVKRQLSSEVADDWLLVLTYRESLLSRYIAGFMVGVLLLGPCILSGAMRLLFVPDGLSFQHLADWVFQQALLVISVLQPVAAATLIVAAADFMVAPVAVVLMVLVVFDTLWCIMPGAGMFIPMVTLPQGEGQAVGAAMMTAVAVLICLCGLGLAWFRSEDFWNYLRVTMAAREKASLGAVRRAVETAQSGTKSSNREALAIYRAWWRRRGVSPLWYHDLARYPAWFMLRRPSKHSLMVCITSAAILFAMNVYREAFSWGTAFHIYLVYFGFWIAAFFLVTRALVSGAQIVVQEKESGALTHLLTAPRSTTGLLLRKLGVVARQAAIPLLALSLVMQLFLPGFEAVAWLWAAAACATVAGVLASALCGTRLLSILVGAVLGALLFTGVTTLWYYASAASLYSTHVSPSGLAAWLVIGAGALLCCTGTAALAWLPALWVLRRQAALR